MLGLVSALMSHFMEIFDKHQIADISFYFMYLLLTAVLLASFGQTARTATAAMENILVFIRLLVPTYLMAVGVASGTTTAGASYQLVLLLIYGVERLLMGGLLPFIYSYVLLAVVNGVWIEEKLSLLMELLEKGIKASLKAIVGVVMGISVFQSVITPVIDSVKTSTLQKIVSAIPGIGGGCGQYGLTGDRFGGGDQKQHRRGAADPAGEHVSGPADADSAHRLLSEDGSGGYGHHQ